MYTLTVTLTPLMSIEWTFSDPMDFNRTGQAVRDARAALRITDVEDVQSLVDAAYAAFTVTGPNGTISCRLVPTATNVERAAA